MIDILKHDLFHQQLHSAFRLHQNDPSFPPLTLVEVTNRPTGNGERFTLLFKSVAWLPQQTYQLKHENLGIFDLFLVPVGKEPDGYLYESVINRDPL